MPAQPLGNASVLEAEYIDCVLRMLKRGERLGLSKDFHADRNAGLGKQIERALVVAEIYALVALHALLAGQALVFRRIHPVASPDERINFKTRTRTDGRRQVVRILGIYKHPSGKSALVWFEAPMTG